MTRREDLTFARFIDENNLQSLRLPRMLVSRAALVRHSQLHVTNKGETFLFRCDKVGDDLYLSKKEWSRFKDKCEVQLGDLVLFFHLGGNSWKGSVIDRTSCVKQRPEQQEHPPADAPAADLTLKASSSKLPADATADADVPNKVKASSSKPPADAPPPTSSPPKSTSCNCTDSNSTWISGRGSSSNHTSSNTSSKSSLKSSSENSSGDSSTGDSSKSALKSSSGDFSSEYSSKSTLKSSSGDSSSEYSSKSTLKSSSDDSSMLS